MLVALIATLLLAGCGTEDGVGQEAATTTPSTTRNEATVLPQTIPTTTPTPTSATVPTVPTTTVPDDTVSEDVRMYAEAFGISEEEAKASLEFQAETAPLLDDLAARFPDVYTTARYVNGADYGLVITVAREVPPAFQEGLDEFMSSRREWQGRVTTQRAQYSSAELKRLSDEMADRLSFLDDCEGVTVVLDSEKATVTVELAEKEEQLTAAIKEALEGYPLPVEFVVTGEHPTLPNCLG